MEYTPLVIEGVKLQPLRIPAGWRIYKHEFFNLEPKGQPKVKGFPNDDGWLLFEQDLLMVKHERQEIILDMGWAPQYDPAGQFILDMVKGDYLRNNPATIYETREKAEIVQALEVEMLRISKASGDYLVEGEDLMLQPLRITGGWRVLHNQFFDLVLQSRLRVRGLPNEDGWAVFGAHMLQLETSFDAEYKIDLSWEPAHDPAGRYVVRLIRHYNGAHPLEQHETRDKDEVTEVIRRLCVG